MQGTNRKKVLIVISFERKTLSVFKAAQREQFIGNALSHLQQTHDLSLMRS